MISKFLNAKHWQLFALQFGVPMLMQIVFITTTISSPGPIRGGAAFPVFMSILILLYVFMLLGWFWSIGVGLNKKIPDEFKLNVKRFKFFLLFPSIYILMFSLLFSGSFMGASLNLPSIGDMVGLIVPLHLFSMFCMFYCMNFVAKTVKTAEAQRAVTFSDYAGDFFLIWFYPVGIWIIQPRVNKLVNGEAEFDAEILDNELEE